MAFGGQYRIQNVNGAQTLQVYLVAPGDATGTWQEPTYDLTSIPLIVDFLITVRATGISLTGRTTALETAGTALASRVTALEGSVASLTSAVSLLQAAKTP